MTRRSVVSRCLGALGNAKARIADLESLVIDLCESLAEAGVAPLAGSDNPHEDTLGEAIDLVPAARAAVERIAAQQAGEDPFSITLDRMSEEPPVDLEGES